jgi:hypothetical protein
MDENEYENEEGLSALDDLSAELIEKLDAAIEARVASSIDQRWQEDDDYYNGLENDDRLLKGKSIDSSLERNRKKSKRANVFLNITRRYTDAAAAKVADMLLPTDDKNWGITPTPIPNIQNFKDDQTPVIDPQTMQPVINESGMQKTVADHFKAVEQEAQRRCDLAEKRIEDWLVQCNFNSEIRKVIEYSAKLGVGVIKGPFPTIFKETKVTREGNSAIIELQEEIMPASKCVSPWNFYPDPSCGESIHNGSYVFERDSLTIKQVRALLDDPSYIKANVKSAMKEGTSKRRVEISSFVDDKNTFEVWYFYGQITREDFIVAGGNIDDEKELDVVDALVIMIGDKVVKATLNPLDSGRFPYDTMPWSKRENTWAGDGIPRQARTTQRMLNATCNSMMDNQGLSTGPNIFLRKSGITPADGEWTITPLKLWYMDDDVIDARQAMQQVNITSNQAEAMGIIDFAVRMTEDVTGLPMLLQGQQGSAPDTLGGMQMLNNNASTVLRRIARTFDDMITEPHLRAYYEWLLMYGEEEEKCDSQIEARGSSALVERDIQNQTISNMMQLSLNPAFGIDPKKAFSEFLKSQRLDPKTFQYTEEELAKMQQQAQQSPPDPRIATAQINQQIKQQELEVKMEDNKIDRDFEMQKLQMQREIEVLKLATQEKLSLEQIKAMLTDSAMKIKNQREIFASEATLRRETGAGV